MSSTLVAGPKVAACVARILDDAKCGYVQWGWENIDLWIKGEKMGFKEIEFVIPDRKIEDAIRVLEATGAPRCKDPKCIELQQDWFDECVKQELLLAEFDWDGRDALYAEIPPIWRVNAKPRRDAKNRVHPVGAAHFHYKDNDGVLTLLCQSKILPWVREIESGLAAPGDPDLLMTDQPGLYPVKVLRPASFAEAVLRLLCRDMVDNEDLEMLWRRMLDSMKEEEALFSQNLRPAFQPAWNALMGRSGYIDPITEVIQLRKELIKDDFRPDRLPDEAIAGGERYQEATASNREKLLRSLCDRDQTVGRKMGLWHMNKFRPILERSPLPIPEDCDPVTEGLLKNWTRIIPMGVFKVISPGEVVLVD